MFNVFKAVAFNPENGDIFLDESISAETDQAARDKVIRKLSEEQFPLAKVVVNPLS